MYRQGLLSFYKGLGSALITQPTYWACYMPLYKVLKEKGMSSMTAGWPAGAIGFLPWNFYLTLNNLRSRNNYNKSIAQRSRRRHRGTQSILCTSV